MQLHVPVLLGEFQGMFEPVFGAVGTVHRDQQSVHAALAHLDLLAGRTYLTELAEAVKSIARVLCLE
jgi:hypothetical protein